MSVAKFRTWGWGAVVEDETETAQDFFPSIVILKFVRLTVTLVHGLMTGRV